MWATASARERWLIPVWVAFASVNTVLMYLMPGAETIPFHFVWVSTAVVYGLRPFSMRMTWLTCAVVTVVTGGALVLHAAAGGPRGGGGRGGPPVGGGFLRVVLGAPRGGGGCRRLGGDQRDPADGVALPGHGLARPSADGGDGRGAPDGCRRTAGAADPTPVRAARLARAAYADHGGARLHGAAPGGVGHH